MDHFFSGMEKRNRVEAWSLSAASKAAGIQEMQPEAVPLTAGQIPLLPEGFLKEPLRILTRNLQNMEISYKS